MASYSYQALDQSGRTKKGLIQAETERQVVEQLQAKGLVPLAFERQQSTTEVQAKQATRVTQGLFVKRLSTSDLCQITQQLSTLLQASLPLAQFPWYEGQVQYKLQCLLCCSMFW